MREAHFVRAEVEREERDRRERLGVKCPRCLKKEDPRHPLLGVVINTWPSDGSKYLMLDICFCGHPWLVDAEKNYLNWLFHGEDHADDYPTMEDWLRDQGSAIPLDMVELLTPTMIIKDDETSLSLENL